MNAPEWHVYHGTGEVADSPIVRLPDPPPWRSFDGTGESTRPVDDVGESDRRVGSARGVRRTPAVNEVEMVNTAIHLRRPLLVTGSPGTGKSSLAVLVARELGLGPVLKWPITSRSVLKDGLYLYDAIGRVQAAGVHPEHVDETDIGDYIHLGPLGTALLPGDLPRVLLIDEIDKGDLDLPNDLLNVFEDGEYGIPELSRIAKRAPEVSVLTADRSGSAVIVGGAVRCRQFPIVIMTSNGEREFPPAFLRRCLRLRMDRPNAAQLADMVAAHFGGAAGVDVRLLISDFLKRADEVGDLASDQLLNAVHMAAQLSTSGDYQPDRDWAKLLKAIWHPLSSGTE